MSNSPLLAPLISLLAKLVPAVLEPWLIELESTVVDSEPWQVELEPSFVDLVSSVVWVRFDVD